jgi:GntR family transcriptional regulator/MocR family aminotransferase
MTWHPSIRPESSTPLHVQIRRGVSEAVRSGALRPGEKLEGVRSLAKGLGVHRLTVLKAIRALTRAGLLTTVRGKGVFVAERPPRLEPRLARREELAGPFFEGVAEGPEDPATALPSAADGIRSTLEDALGDGDHLAFSAGFPAEETIPADNIRLRLGRILRGPRGTASLGYASTEGLPELREELGALLAERGLPLGSEDRILVTGGAQQGITLGLQALLRPGESLALESPGYMGTIAACRRLGIPMVPVPVDRAGLNPERLESALRRGEVGALYTVPNFQNPTGVTQSLRRRTRILEIARRHGAYVIEDDIYSDLRFGGRRIPPLKSLPGGERVLYVGSFSKSLAPGLRLGFLAAHVSLADELRRLKEIADISTGTLSQRLLADLLRDGFYRRHLVRVRREYRRRRDAMLAALEAHLPRGPVYTRPRGGLHLWVMLPRPLDATRLNERAQREGVSFAPGALFFHDGRRSSSFRLNFSTHPPERIETGVRRLARCIPQETP